MDGAIKADNTVVASPAPAPDPKPAADPAPSAPAAKDAPSVAPAAQPAAPAKDAVPSQTITPPPAPAPAAETTPQYPDNWRQIMAGTVGIDPAKYTDAQRKEMAVLERMDSPNAVFKSYRNLETKVGSIQAKVPFPEKGTPEEQNAWRKAEGVPESADKYDLTMPDGLVIGEGDKPIVNGMLTKMHAHNVPQALAAKLIADYFEQEKTYLREREAQTASTLRTWDESMRTEWGGDYQPNVNSIKSLLDTFAPDTQELLYSAIGHDGVPIINNPAVLRDLAQLSRTVNPFPTVVPAGGGDRMGSVDDEIGKIEGLMADRQSEYWKGPKDEKTGKTKLEARYLDLQEWKLRNKPRVA